jgi:hypothetical protein
MRGITACMHVFQKILYYDFYDFIICTDAGTGMRLECFANKINRSV